MIFITGGLASGKRTYAQSLGYPCEECAFDVHELVRAGEDVDVLADMLAAKSVVTCAEVGAGVVPLDPAEREWRDGVGRLARLLVRRSTRAVRMICGIPETIWCSSEQGGGACFDAAPYARLAGDGMFHERPAAACGSLELVIVRHGQTAGNARRSYVGALDEPLSETGREQARRAGVYPRFKRVYVSPMRRARETAAIMFPDADLIVVEGVQEMDFGDFSGRNAEDMLDDAEYRMWVDGGCLGACPDGESRDEFSDRVCAAVERMCRKALERGEERVVLVAHGGTMMALLDRLGDGSRSYFEWSVGNCECYRLLIGEEAHGLSLRVLESGPVSKVIGSRDGDGTVVSSADDATEC